MFGGQGLELGEGLEGLGVGRLWGWVGEFFHFLLLLEEVLAFV